MNSTTASSRTANNITLIRHVAAFFVLITHSYALTGHFSGEPLLQISGGAISFSKIGLILFFFISGFLITQSLVTSSGIGRFIWKRFLRIYPALIVVVFLTVFVLGPLVTRIPVKQYFSGSETWQYLSGATLVRLRFYLPGVFNTSGVNGSLWTLPIEFRLYLLLALLFVAGLIKRRKWYFGFIFLFLMLAFLAQQGNADSPAMIYLSPYLAWGMYFLTGSGIFFVKDKIRVDYRVLIFFLVGWYLARNTEIINIVTELVCFSYLTLWACFKTPVVFSRFFKKNDFSYSMYLYAFPLQQLIISADPNVTPWILVGLTSPAIVPFCLFSWHCIEKPALKWKNRKL
jgi:peptidoglycan/LPS O-acetylase OafA/YrhL